MAALTQNAQRSSTTGQKNIYPLPIKAAETVYAGALVCVDSSGLAVAGTDSSGLTFGGVAFRGFDNALGSNGVVGTKNERYCEVDRANHWSFTVTAGTAKPFSIAYLVNDNEVSATATTNSVVVGRFVKRDPADASAWFVDLGV